MDTADWPEGIGVVKPMEGSGPMTERKPRPQKPQALNCPRCNSTHTKFCYYNNYSLSQPRYFCKTCRRYWTEGGTLRNVPVGGGSRKNKRSSSSSSKKLPNHHLTPPNFPHSTSQNPKIQEKQDLNLTYPPTGNYSAIPEFVGMPYNPRGLTPLMSMPISDSNMIFSSGLSLPFQEFKPSLNFCLDGFDYNYQAGNMQGVQETSARLFFPFEELKTTAEVEQNRGQGESGGYWINGGLGGGSW